MLNYWEIICNYSPKKNARFLQINCSLLLLAYLYDVVLALYAL